jgi:hypothetical protein
MNREDIYEQVELSKVIDIENIPFERLMDILTGFCLSELLATDNMQKLNIDNDTEISIKNYALQGKAFCSNDITEEELDKERGLAWNAHYELANGSIESKLLRIVISCLYDRDSAEYDIYGSGEMLGVFFSLLLDLGPGYCKQFKYYIQNNLVL